MTKNKAVTIYDIAKLTDLSPATISKIINHKGKYAADTCDRVFKAIDELGYIPNIHAKKLASRTTKTLGIGFFSVPSYRNPYLSPFMIGACDNARRYDYNVTIYNSCIEAKYFAAKTIHDFDGIAFPFMASNIIEHISILMQHKKPVVYAGQQMSFDHIGCNVYGGLFLYVREVLEIFYKQNKKSIALFPSYHTNEFSSIYTRYKTAANDFCEDFGLSENVCRTVICDTEDTQQLIAMLDGLLMSHNPPDAMFFDSISPCITAYNHIQQRGLRIPEDISIISVGFDETSGQEFSPALSTIRVDAYNMGYRAVDILLHQINPEKYPAADNDVPYKFIKRDSSC